MILRTFLILIIPILANSKINKDHCIGYLEEVYWALDTIEDLKVREQIDQFFIKNFPNSKNLNYDLYYNPNEKKFISDQKNIHNIDLIKVNYPNFEIIILDAYINLFTQGKDFCPAFWNDCSEESLENFFNGAKDFSETWIGEDFVYEFLEKKFINNQCVVFLRTNINKN